MSMLLPHTEQDAAEQLAKWADWTDVYHSTSGSGRNYVTYSTSRREDADRVQLVFWPTGKLDVIRIFRWHGIESAYVVVDSIESSSRHSLFPTLALLIAGL